MTDWRTLMACVTGRAAIPSSESGSAPSLREVTSRPAPPSNAHEEAAVPLVIVPPIGAMSVDEHFATLGGYDGALAVTGHVVTAFRLWDSHRLWLRDLGRSQQARWDAQYREIWSRTRNGSAHGSSNRPPQ